MTTRGRGRGSGRLNPPNDPEEFDPSTLTWNGICAPRDTSALGSVEYPLTAEGGLNKFHPSYKHARNKEGIDNIKIRNEEMYTFNQKFATQICFSHLDYTPSLIYISPNSPLIVIF